MIKANKTKLDGVLLIQLDSFEDHRGEYVETYNEAEYRAAGIDIAFKQDDYSISKKNVLRGLHGDSETWKLITCPFGKLYLVVVNCVESSKDFGKWDAFVLSDRNHRQVLIPPKFGNGHLVLSDEAMFGYKQSSYYNPGTQFSYKWNDPMFNIWWPVSNPILSRRDEAGMYL
ncbi:MAG: dTDP-4-dehydrorhamnose 3,5-epimerase [Lentisphaerae bacterium RIFOXYA12_FULL_48_11]|nr:MAG: dTDP-4-dehydrorhamnose 3,5-epimerase [Lentisphaerae bacterium RIFOXYA12_FULL_48_11]